MVEIRRADDLTPEEKHQYRQEFSRGIKLFHQALENYNESTEPHQKNEFKKVMNNTLDTMNEMVNVALRNPEQKINNQLKQDYEMFTSNENSESYNKLQKDVTLLEKKLEHG